MLDYMDIVQNAFHAATNWNPDNSYATLNASTRCTPPLLPPLPPLPLLLLLLPLPLPLPLLTAPAG